MNRLNPRFLRHWARRHPVWEFPKRVDPKRAVIARVIDGRASFIGMAALYTIGR